MTKEKERILTRLQIANQALELLAKGQLPHIEQFIMNANFDLQTITDLPTFQRVMKTEDPSLNELLEHSKRDGCIKTAFDGKALKFYLFREPSTTHADQTLQALALGQVVRATYAAIGLDMPGFTEEG